MRSARGRYPAIGARPLAAAAALHLLLLARGAVCESLLAADVSAAIPAAQQLPMNSLNGSSVNPEFGDVSLDTYGWQFAGQRAMRVSGALHYARVPAESWDVALAAMKAGGLNTVQTYIFWIHHEEVEGVWDWSGRRNISDFMRRAQAHGLRVLFRMGPWSHGECRGGGFPDWLEKSGVKLRSTDPKYLAFVKTFFDQVAAQLNGLWWHQGGPIDVAQIENEFGGDPNYLLTLRSMAETAGLVPAVYTKTGWPTPAHPVPFGSLVNMYGGYCDQFWGKNLTPNGPSDVYLYSETYAANVTGVEPWLGIEIGGGMNVAYHYRPVVSPDDVAAEAYTKLGSGAAQLGYYIFRGGVNPHGKLSNMEETQASGGANDMPAFGYDYQAPMGSFGQLREHYHTMRTMHILATDYGSAMSALPSRVPALLPSNASDAKVLRWSVRAQASGGNVSGFVFATNYARFLDMPDHSDLRVALKTDAGIVTIPPPSLPALSVPSGVYFALPLGLPLSNGFRAPSATVHHATSQLITSIGDLPVVGQVHIFAAIGTMVPTVSFVDDGQIAESDTGIVTRSEGRIDLARIEPGLSSALSLVSRSGNDTVVMLPSSMRNRVWTLFFGVPDLPAPTRVMLTVNDTTLTGSPGRSDLVVSVPVNFSAPSATPKTAAVWMLPAPSTGLTAPDATVIKGSMDGLFTKFDIPASQSARLQLAASWVRVREAGPPRKIPIGYQGKAVAPTDADWLAAAAFNVTVSEQGGAGDLPADLHAWLSIEYVGDAARVLLDGTVLNDNFYNGNLFEVGLTDGAAPGFSLSGSILTLEILPLQKGAPIFMPKFPVFPPGDNTTVLSLGRIDVLGQASTTLTTDG